MKKMLLGLLSATLFATNGIGLVQAQEALPTENIEASITVQAEAEWVPYYEAAIERVKETNPNATIEIIEVGAMDHLDVIDNTDAMNEDVADVFAIPADRLYGLTDNEVLGALDAPTMAENIGGFENYDEGFGGQFNIDGEYFGFPMNIETLIVYGNTANAEANGIDITQPVELTEANYNDILIPLFDAWYGIALINSSEIELLGKAEDDTLFSDFTASFADLDETKQNTISAIFQYWKDHFDNNTSLFDAEAGWGYIDEAFSSGGTASLRIGGPWDAPAISALANDGADLEIYPIDHITVAGKPLAHWQGGWAHAINSRIEADPNQVALAQVLIQELMNPEFAADLFKTSGKIMPHVAVDDYLGSELPEIDKKVIEATINSYENAPNRPLFSEWGQVWDTWKNAVLSWNSVAPDSAEAAYQEINASFQAMMTNLGY